MFEGSSIYWLALLFWAFSLYFNLNSCGAFSCDFVLSAVEDHLIPFLLISITQVIIEISMLLFLNNRSYSSLYETWKILPVFSFLKHMQSYCSSAFVLFLPAMYTVYDLVLGDLWISQVRPISWWIFVSPANLDLLL